MTNTNFSEYFDERGFGEGVGAGQADQAAARSVAGDGYVQGSEVPVNARRVSRYETRDGKKVRVGQGRPTTKCVAYRARTR